MQTGKLLVGRYLIIATIVHNVFYHVIINNYVIFCIKTSNKNIQKCNAFCGLF